jgi:hypothetical protein
MLVRFWQLFRCQTRAKMSLLKKLKIDPGQRVL